MLPLDEIKVVEIAGLGPVPFAGMLLAELGADVMRIDRTRPAGFPDPMLGAVGRGRRSIAIDLKQRDGVDVVLRLVEDADVFLEGFRPGVVERLGVGPEECLAVNPRLVYGRMTGWGRDGPFAAMAGHDINYLGLTGALHAVGPAEHPVAPLNLLADYGGGSMYLLAGILAALVDRDRSGGRVVDAAMVDGVASLMAPTYQMFAAGLWDDEREANLLDGGAPFYRTYATADGGWMAVGALEPQFYAALVEGLGLAGADLPAQTDRSGWPQLAERFAVVFASRTRAEWESVFAGTDACVTPVLSLREAPEHAHNRARAVFHRADETVLPTTGFRLGDRVPLEPSPGSGSDTDELLAQAGYSAEEIAGLRRDGVVA